MKTKLTSGMSLGRLTTGGGSGSRTRFGKIGVRTSLSSGNRKNAIGSEKETVTTRYLRFIRVTGRMETTLDHLAIIHPDHGSKAYHNFYKRKEWLNVRKELLRVTPWCACCGVISGEKLKTGSMMHLEVDHIWPRLFFPHLELHPDNFQMLCLACNRAKGNTYSHDWRVGDVPYNYMGSFWHLRPHHYEQRNLMAQSVNSLNPYIT